jgi:homoserine trans-succinylase
MWRERVAEVETRLKVAEQQSAEANDSLAKKAEEKIKYIRGKTEYINQYIDREVIKYDTKFMPGGICEIPQEFIKAHNDAAEKPKK